MEKQNIFAPLFILLLGIAFASVTLLLFFSKNNPGLIRRKLKLGAAILSITSFLNTGVVAQEKMCYKVSMQDIHSRITLFENQFGNGEYFYKTNDTIRGRIFDYDEEKKYSYSIVDSLDKKFSSGHVIIRDTLVFIPLKKIDEGKYFLKIFETGNGVKSPFLLLNKEIEVIENKNHIENTCYFF